MSRAAAKQGEEMQQDDAQIVRCLLIPQNNSTLLLPNTVVAEVAAYTPPEIAENSPEWLLGTLSWRGNNVPLVAFENIIGESLAQQTPRQVAVLNTLNRNPDLPFMAITFSNLPRLVHVDSSSVVYMDRETNEIEPEAILARMRLSGEPVVIPNLDFIEAQIIRLGMQ